LSRESGDIGEARPDTGAILRHFSGCLRPFEKSQILPVRNVTPGQGSAAGQAPPKAIPSFFVRLQAAPFLYPGRPLNERRAQRRSMMAAQRPPRSGAPASLTAASTARRWRTTGNAAIRPAGRG
jgi:hypothetical protein